MKAKVQSGTYCRFSDDGERERFRAGSTLTVTEDEFKSHADILTPTANGDSASDGGVKKAARRGRKKKVL